MYINEFYFFIYILMELHKTFFYLITDFIFI